MSWSGSFVLLNNQRFPHYTAANQSVHLDKPSQPSSCTLYTSTISRWPCCFHTRKDWICSMLQFQEWKMASCGAILAWESKDVISWWDTHALYLHKCPIVHPYLNKHHVKFVDISLFLGQSSFIRWHLDNHIDNKIADSLTRRNMPVSIYHGIQHYPYYHFGFQGQECSIWSVRISQESEVQ